MSSEDSSISDWLGPLQEGAPEAVRKLWDRYFTQLVALARKKLEGIPRRIVDEEDVALSAFESFCRGAAQGRFPELRDRDNLWRLLVVITARKAIQARLRETRQKRGGGKVVLDEAALSGPHGDEKAIEQFFDREPTPDMAAQLADELHRLSKGLGDDELRVLLQLKLEGHTNEEIAVKLSCSPRSVDRKLRVVRGIAYAQRDLAD